MSLAVMDIRDDEFMKNERDVAAELEQGSFARALALTSTRPDSEAGIWQPWAYFRLGMYSTVTSLDITPNDERYVERQLLPAVVSTAACGDFEKARNLLRAAPWKSIPSSLRLAIAKHLSLYMPQEALHLLHDDGDRDFPEARILVLLRAGSLEEGRELLARCLKNQDEDRSPGLHLFRTVVDELLPGEQLDCLNAVHTAFGISPVELIRSNEPLNPCNVCSLESEKIFEKSLISVLMTSFNASDCIASAIESILNQSYQNIELIVVDDCSTDDSCRVIQSYVERDSRVKLVKLSRNVGTYCAKSIGLKHACGEFVTCMDADDWAHPLKLELQVQPLMRDQSLIATTSRCVVFHDDGTVDIGNGTDVLLMNHSSLLFRREKVLAETGAWDSGVRVSADSEIIWRLYTVYGAQSIVHLQQPLSLISRRMGTLTQSKDDAGFGGGKFPAWRLRYFESCNRWHINCYRSGVNPRIDQDIWLWNENRSFRVPGPIRVKLSPGLSMGSEGNELDAMRYAERDDFARALSVTCSKPGTREGMWQPWAYFRLGMYQTVSSLDIHPCNPMYAERQLLPAIVSQAALGQHALVRGLLNEAPWGDLPTSLRIAIAKHLSSYMPQEALRLLDGVDSPVPASTQALLLLRAGHKKQAKNFVRSVLDEGIEIDQVSFHLYQTLTEAMAPQQQLACLNRVHTAYGLPVLALLRDDNPPSPHNVYSPDYHAFVDGPLVSVLMTTFNVVGRVSAAIESILQQSYHHLELIVVDDLSTDDTVSEVMEWVRKDSRVRLLRLGENVGTYCAKSVGLKYASGDFVTCMDADDWSHPLKLELQIKPLLEDRSLVATASNWIRVFDTGVVDTLERVDLVHLNYSSLLFRREKVLSEIGGWDVCARTGGDVEFVRRLDLIYGRQAVRHIVAPLSLASRRGDSLTMANDGTGFLGGVFPPELLKYIEAFNHWHIKTLHSHHVPRVDADPMIWASNHPFRFSSSVFSDASGVTAVLGDSYEMQ